MTVMVLLGIFIPTPPYYIPTAVPINNGIILGIILVFAGPAYVEFKNSRWLRGIDLNAPRLLRDVTETVQSGVPLFRALEEASTRDYGPITKHLETAMVQFNFTSDLEGSLKWLGEKLVRPSMKRITTIIIEAYKTGGDIIDVLNTSVEIFNDVAEFNEERRSQMKPYLLIVYLGTLIFLVISWLMLTRFLAPMVSTSADPMILSSGFINRTLDIEYYRGILFWAAVMEAIFGGLIIGKIVEGKVAAGMIHSIILLLITVILFNTISL
jgi:flagellar protein FlaJ